MAQPNLYHQQHWPTAYGPAFASTTFGAYHGLHKRSAEAETAPEAAPEAKPVVPLYGLNGGLVYHHALPLAYAPALPTLAHPYAALAHPYAALAHPYAALAHPYAALAHPALVHPYAALAHPAPIVVAPAAAPAPNDPTAPAAWAAAHPEGLAHESVAGGLRTNHGDGTSYVFRSNI